MRLTRVVPVFAALALGAVSSIAWAAEPRTAIASAEETAAAVPPATASSADTPDSIAGVPAWLVPTAPSLMPAGFSFADVTATATTESTASAQTTTRRPRAFEYSDAYVVRRKIHKYASFATLPLFGVEYVLGNKLWDDPVNASVRDAHGAIATAIAGLFAVNTVTGVWNLWEGRKDPNGGKKRVIHSILMLGADAGFLATGALAPSLVEGGGDRELHRTVALTSIGVATVSYLMMLMGR